MSIVAALVIACAVSVPMDLLWRRLGAVRGTRALVHMTRLSLDPASRVRRIQTFFERYGNRVLLIAKFVPGLTVLAPALAGMVKVPLTQFLILDIAGVLLWAGSWMSLGYLFGRAPELILAQTTRAGILLAGLAAAFAVYVLLKTVRRQRLAFRPLLGRLGAWLAPQYCVERIEPRNRQAGLDRVARF
jgi:membrane protein DedA with SNARE-associated domain